MHIAIENRATPAEMRQLLELIDNRYANSPASDWINPYFALSNLSRKAEPENYFRSKIGPNLYLYSNGVPAASKTLIVGFPGGAGRLMMPTSLLLQFLKAGDADLLFINHRGPDTYDKGVPRLGDDFLGTIATLEGVLRKLGYKRHVALGTSVGGLPALFAAILLDFDRGTSVGNAVLNPEVWKKVLEHPKCQSVMAQREARPKLLAVYSQLNERDNMAANELNARLPLVLLPIRAKMHNTLWGILNNGELSKFLSLVTMTGQAQSQDR